MSTVRIALVGPSGVGKSKLANALVGDFTVYPNLPTTGLRIRETRVPLNTESGSATVEIWDLSGDQKYEKGWEFVRKNIDGVAIVYNPMEERQSKEVSLWMEEFCETTGFETGQVVIFALNLPPNENPAPIKFEGKQGAAIKIPIVGLSLPKTLKSSGDIHFSGSTTFQDLVETCYKMHPDNKALDEEDDAFLDGNS